VNHVAQEKGHVSLGHARTGKFITDKQAMRAPADKVVHDRVSIGRKKK
jgi:hypothetical protein